MNQYHINYNQIATGYAIHRQIHPGVLQTLVEGGAITDQATVLEVGCGTANYLTALTQTTTCSGYGLEPSKAMLTEARKKGASITLKQGQAEQLDYPNNTFDFIYSVDVIHHVQNRAAYYDEAFRVLKPKGCICTVTDSASVIARRKPLSNYFPETVAIELDRYPRMAVLRGLMTQAGFSQIDETETEFTYALTSSQPYHDRAFSSLHLISETALSEGLTRMDYDLAQGPIEALSLYTLLWGVKV